MEKVKNKKSEVSKKKQPAKAKGSYLKEQEVIHSHDGSTDNYTEQNDVTGPDKREFPSVGHAQADFASRPTGRRTGRMVGHEPGTEGL